MCKANNRIGRRGAFTLVELLVVIAIILVISALAAAFAPDVSASNNLTRAVDQMEQWLLTAKMRAKRDGLATGVRFMQTPGDQAGHYSQVQYIQQPGPMSGSPTGGKILSAGYTPTTPPTPSPGNVYFSGVDFSMGGAALAQGLVQTGDYLEVRGSGVYLIGTVSSPTQLALHSLTGYNATLSIISPTQSTTNYRILRQPRILIGEDPLNLPNNFAVDMNTIPGTSVAAAIPASTSSGHPEILFAPTGEIVGTNAGSGQLYLFVHDVTILNATDIFNISGLVAVQCRTGFIGAYSVAPGTNPFAFAQAGRESGL